MSFEDGYAERAAALLEESGFHAAKMKDLDLPGVEYASSLDGTIAQYLAFGDVQEAEAVHVTVVPYTTLVKDRSQQVRGHAEHIGQGGGTALVKTEVYNPWEQRLPHKQRAKVAEGDFSPLAQRLSNLVEQLHLRDDQHLYMSGFSMGGDVTAEVLARTMSDPNFYFPHRIDGVGIFEAARMVNRNRHLLGRRASVAIDFARSGKDLHDNVLASQSPALLEARGIDPDNPKAKKDHDKWVMQDGARWMRRDIEGNWALLGGFGTDQTAQQLNRLRWFKGLPNITLIRMADSWMMPEASIRDLAGVPGFELITEPGDHSAADNVVRAAGHARRVVEKGSLGT